jgi:hypothetical protein
MDNQSFQQAVESRLAKRQPNQPTQDRLTSYAGYPVVSAKSLGLEDYFNKNGKEVAGMAWGGKKNPPEQGGGSPSMIVPNQNYFKDDPIGYNALVRLEASRHWMDENDYNPKFKITPEMQAWREKMFSNMGPAGEAYLKDDNAFRQTIISREVGGDANVPKLSEEALKEIKFIEERLDKAEKNASSNYGKRPDGTEKGSGWLGEIKLPDGSVATEYTTQSKSVKTKNKVFGPRNEIRFGKQIDFPTLVPTLSKEEIELMRTDIIPNKKEIPETIMQKAIKHARNRLAEGKSVFVEGNK